MIVEVTRFRRRFLTFGPNPITNVMLALVLVIYFSLILVLIAARGSIPPLALVMGQTGIFALAAPAMLHSAIVGERERRSWDLLLVAPISKAQIVVGKFLGALSALSVASFFFAIPIALSWFLSLGKSLGGGSGLIEVILGELVSLSFTILVCAFTMLISARVKRSFMALGVTLGSLLVFLGLLPALFGTALSGDRIGTEFLLLGHPLMALNELYIRASPYQDTNDPLFSMALYGLPHVVIYSALSAVMIGWTINTLTFAENEVKFLPKSKSALRKAKSHA